MGRKEYLAEWKKNNPDYHKDYWESQKKAQSCVVCGDTFMAVRKAKTCSYACRGKLRTLNKTILLQCEVCGKEFRRGLANVKTGRGQTCSDECRYKRHGKIMTGEGHPLWRDAKESFTCVICGDEFKRYRKDESRNKTCSKECKYIHIGMALSGENHYLWVGGRDAYRGANWQPTRKEILERDGNVCQECGKTAEDEMIDTGRELSVHHIIPYRFFNDDYENANKPDNLITLCGSCHLRQDSHRWKEVEESCQK